MNHTHPKTDWHPADIKAGLEKAGYSFARIQREYGYAGNTAKVLRMPWYNVQDIVGEILGVPPMAIWPSRYHADGRPKDRRATRLRKSG